MKSVSQITALILLGAILTGCAPAATPTLGPAICEGPTITISEISADDPAEVMDDMLSLAEYLARRLAPQGIECGRVVVPASAEALAELVNKGGVDIFFDSLYPAALVSDKTGAQPLLRRWRNDDPEYFSLLIARKDSGISSIQDLRGHIIAMDHAQSTSGFAVAAQYLLDQGLHLSVKQELSDAVALDEVGIVFTGADTNSLSYLNERKVDAVVTDDFYYEKKLDPQNREELKVLWQSNPIIRQVVMVRPGLSAELQAAIKAALLGADKDPEGSAAMQRAGETSKFDELPLGADAVLAQMQEINARVRTISGLP